MCSGCSGHFDDGEDWDRVENEALDDDFERRRAGFGGQAMDAGGFDSGFDEYEVLVGPDQIVERRVIRSKGRGFNGLHGISAEAVARLTGAVREVESQHSSLVTARDYRTLCDAGPARADSGRAWCNLLLWCHLGAAAAAALVVWLGMR